MVNESQIRELLESNQKEQQWNDLVADWRVTVGEDSLDEPAIWVWVILEEESQEFPQQDAIRRDVRKLILGRMANLGEDHWVYVRFTTKAEEAEEEEGLDDSDQQGDFDESRIRERLLEDQQEQPWNDLVTDWKVEIREKPLDDLAIWVWGILERSQEFDQKKSIHQRARKVILDHTAAPSRDDLQIHVRFRTKDEQDEQDRWEALERQDNVDHPQEALA